MLSLLGLLISAVMWIGAMRAIAWTWNRQVLALAAAGFTVDERDQRMTTKGVARYHTLGWSIAFFIFFVLLGLAGFPLWQLLAFSGLLALVYGTSAIARGERDWVGRSEPDAVALFGQLRDAAWYRLLMVLEWTTYLAMIVFASNLLDKLIT